ncbi:MAG TPA: formate C-acetyltransferase [Acholeplasmataceae bacterium]|jgi:formate C-acetyltransferase|nr:formate C-acetyltransferase [Acholeplasmataceae bacterium]
MKAWRNFKGERWQQTTDVRDFIQQNYTPYDGDEKFLEKATPRTKALLEQFNELLKIEGEQEVIDMETDIVSQITAYDAAYMDKENEVIVGLQTDKPLKRALHPFGGIKIAKKALEAYGYNINPEIEEIFTKYRKTHNQGVFDVYTKQMRDARRSGIITGLPDGYGRGRIIGDYRRVALYGIDFLISKKKEEKEKFGLPMTEETIRAREEIQEQINALNELKELGNKYGFDLSRPAENAQEAIQWLYFGYLGAVKEQNGAAMSFGRDTTFIDIYIERDLQEGTIDESFAQELIDQLVLKLRMIRFARTPEYNDLFTGDPNWVTESIGGIGLDGRHLVTKTSYRMLNTLYNLGPSAEPNMTVLWSEKLPENFKKFAAKVSIDTSSIQYENDNLMRKHHGDDYAISCCVSPMAVGKETQFFGARANLAKALLYALNDGKDEISGVQLIDNIGKLSSDVLDYDEVYSKYDKVLDWLAELYVNTLNVIHYMHDKYAYERLQMALHDYHIKRNFATGIAGLSVVADSLSAIKYAKVKAIRNEEGLTVDFEVEGDYPRYGNNDDRVDEIATTLVAKFKEKISQYPAYRNAEHSLSVLTITSNVVYGKKTGTTPDGRKKGEPFAPGANPMHGRDKKGALASLLSVSKLRFEDANDGISNTFSIVPEALGNTTGTLNETEDQKVTNLVQLLDGYFINEGHHLNVNVFSRDLLLDAMENKEKYPNLTIRVSGYAVNFHKLTKEQQLEVINRTFHSTI